MEVIAVINQKGGSKKTNTAVNLSAELAAMNFRVLHVDADPQGTSRAFMTSEPPKAELADLLLGRGPKPEDAIMRIERWNLDLLGSTTDALENTELQMSRDASRITKLGEILGDLEHRYDRVVIDCPPNLGPIVQAAMIAATAIIVPVDGTEALDGLLEIEQLQKRLARISDARMLGTLIAGYKPRTKHFRQVEEAIEELSPFTTRIRDSVVARELHANQLPARLYKPKSALAQDYAAFAREVEARLWVA
jgi:chromosome partitioning protein